ncbi:hypothetical protein F3Y22_tig00110809pilonHSYRG00110 [Hibiscus syriacus]|uniref:Uncharacterized protein n=1 Tax=Hibiscus syriacus TaxID=106335 RepID=A0A6A2ZQ99_HIBSY|nr:hypothetical protein F3Y22_tig00110809pilonHSYRG00110 [Hibiscus syriacus]
MGVSFSCPFAKCSDVENGLESITVKSISFGDDGVRTPLRSITSTLFLDLILRSNKSILI